MNGNNGRALTPQTLIPLGSAAVIVVSLITATWWLGTLRSDIEQSIDGLRGDLQSIRYRMDRYDERMLDRWTATHMKLWVSEAKRRNPTVDLPGVSETVR